MNPLKTKMNVRLLTNILVLTILTLVGGTLANAYDVGNYQVLEPSFLDNKTEISSFAEWSGIMVKTILSLIAGISVIQLAYGGIEYVLSASLGGKNDGKQRIQDALIGLGIALAAVLILNIINPDLVNFPGFLQ